MGRFITQAASGVSLTNKQKSLQNGTTKWLPDGSPRACYAMVSYNTSSTGYSVAMYDKYFQTVNPNTYPVNATTLTTNGVPHLLQLNSSNDASSAGWLLAANGNFSATQGTPSTSSAYFLSGMSTAGEFGCAYTDIYSNGTISSVFSRDTNWLNKYQLNVSFFNSDHTDRSIVYLFWSGAVRAVSRVDGSYGFNYVGTREFSIPGMSGSVSSMWGSCSYNNVRKEFVVFSYWTSGGAFYVRIYKGIDFDKFPSPADAFTAPGVTVVDKSIASTPSWGSNSGDSLYCVKPVLCDDGTIFMTAFHEGTSLAMYRYTRDASDNLTAAVISSKSTTTSYGHDQGLYYRQKSIQSRDGGAVLSFCPYYYYSCGLRSYVVDKRKSTVFDSASMDTSGTSFGVIPLPFGDSGFCGYSAGNVYAGNPTGGFITATIERVGAANAFAQSGSNIYLPHFPLPNTTNYPGFTQVTDYSMLDNQFIA
jgi:hypothetical protein